MNRAVVIKYGDPDLSKAIADGMVRALADDESVARMAVKEDRDRAYWAQMIEEADYYYGDNPRHCSVVKAIIGLYGLAILKLDELFRRCCGDA